MKSDPAETCRWPSPNNIVECTRRVGFTNTTAGASSLLSTITWMKQNLVCLFVNCIQATMHQRSDGQTWSVCHSVVVSSIINPHAFLQRQIFPVSTVLVSSNYTTNLNNTEWTNFAVLRFASRHYGQHGASRCGDKAENNSVKCPHDVLTTSWMDLHNPDRRMIVRTHHDARGYWISALERAVIARVSRPETARRDHICAYLPLRTPESPQLAT